MRSDSLISNFSVDALFFIIQYMSSKAILQIYEVTVKIRSVGAVRLDETWLGTENMVRANRQMASIRKDFEVDPKQFQVIVGGQLIL